MKKYKIYAGLGGGFGGAEYIETVKFNSLIEAEDYALDVAVEIYESYVGNYGLRTIDEIIEEDEVDFDEAVDIYNEEMHNWIEYYAEESNA